MNVIFGSGATAPDLHLRMISAIPGDTPSPVKPTVRLDLCLWHTSGFE